MQSGTFQITDARDIVLKVLVPEGSQSGAYSFRAELGGQPCSDSFQVGEPDTSYVLYIITLLIAAVVFGVVFMSRRRK